VTAGQLGTDDGDEGGMFESSAEARSLIELLLSELTRVGLLGFWFISFWVTFG
jgi:hypothetical protein